jgi:hypothetical protein
LIVVDLAWRLNEVHLGWRLIYATDWWGLIQTRLRRWLIVDLGGLSDQILHGQ